MDIDREDLAALGGRFTFEAPRVAGRLVDLPYRIGEGDGGGPGGGGERGGVRFVERIELPVEVPDTPEAWAAVRVLHLVAGVSYYKCVAPTALVVPSLTDAERALVERLYDDGLREFAHRNGLGVPLPVELVTDGALDGTWPSRPEPRPGIGSVAPASLDGGALVPVGGGKDSALVASLVPEGHLFSVNPVGAQEHFARSLDRPLLAARRTLDPLLRRYVEHGAPNGHVPVTAITSAISVVAAVALGLGDVVMGIERSADEPSLVTADGVPVNHQFSKSSEAEALLAAAFAPTGVRYFSLLRPMTELAIGAAVARRGLADDIVSCNRVFTVWNETTASREQRPCGTCAKCLFTALMIAPASSPAEVSDRYGTALLDRSDHVDAVRELWSDEKPFDCVGERLESAAAVALLATVDGWRDQAVVRELAAEASGVLAAAGSQPGDLLAFGSLEALPGGYRDRVAALQADLASDVAVAPAPAPAPPATATSVSAEGGIRAPR